MYMAKLLARGVLRFWARMFYRHFSSKTPFQPLAVYILTASSDAVSSTWDRILASDTEAWEIE